MPEETPAERAWRETRPAAHPEPKPTPEDAVFVDQLVRWGGYSRKAAIRAMAGGPAE